MDAALDEFRQGALLQLWLKDSDDIPLGHADSRTRPYFDGLTAYQVVVSLDTFREPRPRFPRLHGMTANDPKPLRGSAWFRR